MRRVISILLLLFVTTQLGMNIVFHFCDGKLASISINKTESCCCKSKQSGKKDCCRDTSVKLSGKEVDVKRIIISLSLNKPALVNHNATSDFFVGNCVEEILINSKKISHYHDNHSPPLYIQYCSYLI